MADYCCLACSLNLAVACKQTEARIRADQRAFDLQELQATARDLDWLLDRIDDEGATDEHLDSLRAHVRRLTVPPSTETVGEPPAQPEGPPAANQSHLRRENEQLRRRNEVLQAEVRRLRAERSAA